MDFKHFCKNFRDKAVPVFLFFISTKLDQKFGAILPHHFPHHFVFFNSLASTQFQISRHPIRVISVVSEQ
jgi:hypothetical protein